MDAPPKLNPLKIVLPIILVLMVVVFGLVFLVKFTNLDAPVDTWIPGEGEDAPGLPSEDPQAEDSQAIWCLENPTLCKG